MRSAQRIKYATSPDAALIFGHITYEWYEWAYRKYYSKTTECSFAIKVVLWLELVYFGNVLLKAQIGMLLLSWKCISLALIYNACQLEQQAFWC